MSAEIEKQLKRIADMMEARFIATAPYSVLLAHYGAPKPSELPAFLKQSNDE